MRQKRDEQGGDGYLRECRETNRKLDKYMLEATERLCSTVKTYTSKECSQEFLRSLVPVKN